MGRWGSALVLGAMSLVVTACGQVAVGGGGEPPACEQPYETAWSYFQPPSSPPPPQPSPVEGTPRPEPERPPFDTDGDGVEDTLDYDGTTVTVHRSTGDLVLQTEGQVYPATFRAHSDLDADGLSDLFVEVDEGPGIPTYYWVPGATPDGTLDPVRAGVRLFANGTVPSAWDLMGDLDGDGHEDFGVYTTEDWPTLRVWSGATVARVGPGGIDFSEPTVYAGQVLGRWLTDSGELAMAFADEETQEVVVHTASGATRYTTVDSAAPLRITYSTVQLFDAEGGQTWLELETSDRSGTWWWVWDVDDPCAGPIPTTTTTAMPTTTAPTN